MKDFIIAPSILAADFARLGEETKAVLSAGADWIHFDVMDNHYVPNLTVGPLVCKALRNYGIKAPIDVHLMVQPVDALIESFAEAGASIITFHPEASLHVNRSLKRIRTLGCKAGLALNPATSFSWLDHAMEDLDLILVMSVNPGFGGQSFIPSSLGKIKQLKQHILEVNPQIRLAVDGGVTLQNLPDIVEAGADTIIAGTTIFSSNDYASTLQKMRKVFPAK